MADTFYLNGELLEDPADGDEYFIDGEVFESSSAGGAIIAIINSNLRMRRE